MVANERVVHARVVEQLSRLHLRYVAERLDAVLNEAARAEPTYLDFFDTVLRQEVDAKQRTRVAMGPKIAHFPTVKTLDEFDFTFQPSIDQRLVRNLAFLAQAENVLTSEENTPRDCHRPRRRRNGALRPLYEHHRAARRAVENRNRRPAGGAADVLHQAEAAHQSTSSGTCPSSVAAPISFFQLVARRYERASLLITTNQLVTQWGTVFRYDVLAAAILDRLRHHSHTLRIQGESFRLRQEKKAGVLGRAHRNEG